MEERERERDCRQLHRPKLESALIAPTDCIGTSYQKKIVAIERDIEGERQRDWRQLHPKLDSAFIAD